MIDFNELKNLSKADIQDGLMADIKNIGSMTSVEV